MQDRFSTPFPDLAVRVLIAACLVGCSTCLFAQASAPASVVANVNTSSELVPTPGSRLIPLPPIEEGDLMLARRNYVAAIRAYQQANLTSPVVWNKIGIAYHHLFALEEARKAYESALTINPRYADALNNLAAVYHAEHHYRLAETTYKRALKVAPGMAVTYLNLGTSYFAEGKYKQGMKEYRQALNIDPEVMNSEQLAVGDAVPRQQLIQTNYCLAKTYAAAGRLQQALKYLRKAFDEGFDDRKHLMQDKEFASLRTTPEFHQLLLEQHLD